MRRIATLAAAAALAVSSLILAPVTAQAGGPSCDGSWSMGVGGFVVSLSHGTGQPSTYMGVDQPVGYNGLNPVGGLRELDRLYWQHRNRCPGDHVKILGHSMGAAIVHTWVSEHRYEPRVSAVLLSDPKRAAGPGSDGLAGNSLNFVVGYPLAGTDANFGIVPVLSVCNSADVVCNEVAGWHGYLFTGAHTNYSADADDYPDNASGVWFR